MTLWQTVHIFILNECILTRGTLQKLSFCTCRHWHAGNCTKCHLTCVDSDICHSIKLLMEHVLIMTRGVMCKYLSDTCPYGHLQYCRNVYLTRVHIETWRTVQFFLTSLHILRRCRFTFLDLTHVDIDMWDNVQNLLKHIPIIRIWNIFCRVYVYNIENRIYRRHVHSNG